MRPQLVLSVCFSAVILVCATQSVMAATIYASGQLLIPGDPAIPAGQPGHDDSRENYVFAIDSTTGDATPVSPVTSGLPGALGATVDGTLWGWSSNTLQIIDPNTGTTTPAGPMTAFSATGFDVTTDGVGYGITLTDDQLFSVDLTTGVATSVGVPGAANVALAAAGAVDPDAFIISLGSVGDSLYGIDLDTDSLLEFDPVSGTAAVVGSLGGVDGVGAGIFSGYAGLTGVDENADGEYESLFGVVNFIDPGGPVGSVRLGGIARFDLGDGSWDLVGLNDNVIFFGLASAPAVPEPGTFSLLFCLGIASLSVHRVRRE
ncbi:MAG: PEP-CTERM sorting domain-containing protein [Planctomycetota bacterium]